MSTFGDPAFVLPGNVALFSAIYPVGIVVTFGVSTNPATLFGMGTWTAIAGRVIVGIDSGQTEFDALDETGGAKTVALTTAELATHTHIQDSHNHTQNAHTHVQTKTSASGGASTDFEMVSTRNTTYQAAPSSTQSTTATNIAATATNQNAGSGTAHNNLQPYIVKYVWQRAA